VQRRIIDLLSQLGVCCSYKTVLEASKKISQISREEVAALSSRPDSVTAYDNFEQTLGVKGERRGDHSEFYSVTTGEVLLGREIPSNGLSQDMLNPSSTLMYPQLMNAPGMRVDTVEIQVGGCSIIHHFHRPSHAEMNPTDSEVLYRHSAKSCLS
jgi:hypothetical protein